MIIGMPFNWWWW